MSEYILADLVLEQHVLGSVILDSKNLLRFNLNEADFWSSANQIVWRTFQAMAHNGEEINTSTLRASLADIGKLQQVGGDHYLLSLCDTIPDSHLPVERLRKLRRLRGIETAARSVLSACLSADMDRAISGLAEAQSASLAGAARNATVDVLELCESLFEDLAKPSEPGELFHPGYEIMARVLGLIPRQTTVGVLADTNVGKSSFALEVLRRMAQNGTVAGYISVEDQRPRVRARVAGMLTGVSSKKILQRSLTREDFEHFAYGFQNVVALKGMLHISILQGGTDADVCAAMSELAQRGCKVVCVDYLQKITPSRSNRQNKAHEVADIATRITSHGQRLDLVTFLLSQCTRDKQRQNECPSKHDMKESGDLENMLDVIIGLWREYEADDSPTWARLLKTKDGGLGGSWCLQRDGSGRLEEVANSDRMDPPDGRREWTHRSRKQW